MKPQHFVKLMVIEDGKEPKRGTAYRIAPHLLLTSAHVLDGSKQALAWFDARSMPVPARRVWEAQEGDLDAAILEHSPDGLAPVERPFFAARLLRRPRDWCSMGWAAAGKIEPQVQERLDGLEGRAYPSTATHPGFEVTVGDPPETVERKTALGRSEVSGWAGISGAPVFVGLSIYGVVRKLKKGYADRLVATSIVALREDAGFRRWSGLDARKTATHDRALREVEKLLDDSVVQRLATELPELEGKNVRQAAVTLCRAESLIGVARGLNRVHEAACQEDAPEPHLERIEQIAAWVGPSVFFASLAVGAVPDDQPLREELAVAFPHLVELTLAGSDGKPYAFEPTAEARALPRPRHLLSLPAEAGIDAGAEGGLDEFLRHLAGEISFDPRISEQFGSSREALLGYLNEEFAEDAASLGGRRPFLAVKPEHRRDEANALAQIEGLLEELHVVDMVGKGTREEYGVFLALRNLIHRAHQRRGAT